VDCFFHGVQRDDSMGGAIYCFDARGERVSRRARAYSLL